MIVDPKALAFPSKARSAFLRSSSHAQRFVGRLESGSPCEFRDRKKTDNGPGFHAERRTVAIATNGPARVPSGCGALPKPVTRCGSCSIVEENWRVVAELEAMANLVPRSSGGTERGLLPLALVVEELSSASLSPNLAVLTAVATILIARHGSAPLRDQHLPEVARGSRRYCLAITEEEAGFNILRATTAAHRDGNHYRLTGRKRYISVPMSPSSW